jgi:hypothetical protein
MKDAVMIWIRDYLILLIAVQILALLIFVFWLNTDPPKIPVVIFSFFLALLLAIVWPILLGLLFENWRGKKIKEQVT